MPPPTCCTCALHLPSSPPLHPKTEKPIPSPRTLPCCSRIICSQCQHNNPRFHTYCPFCQISTSTTSAIPPEGLRLPPSYTKTSVHNPLETHPTNTTPEPPPPSYASLSHPPPSQTPTSPTSTPDITHHLSPHDSIPSLSLLYRIPPSILLSHNHPHLPHPSLLPALKTLSIPSTHYTGPSLSTPPDPIEEERKNKLRRWMVATKCADYDVAGLYLKASDYDLEMAVESWRGDERWERENPLRQGDKGKGRRRVGGMGLSGQLS